MAKTKTTRAKRERSAPVATEQEGIEEAMARGMLISDAWKALNGVKTADDVREVWKAYYLKIGHRLLGRLLLGQDVEQAMRKRRNSDNSE